MNELIKNKRRGEKGDVYIGRLGPWGNPIRLVHDTTAGRKQCLVEYWDWLNGTPEGLELFARLGELKGKTLLCWCAPKLCHGHILARLANDDPLGGHVYCTNKINEYRKELSI